MNFPFLVFVGSFALTVLATWIGDKLRKRVAVPDEARADVSNLLGPSLTLLFFIIGFSFSMAISRYDLRGTVSWPRRMPSAPSIPGPICWLPRMR